ncbi:MAG: COX15/CtaA family protein [Gemmatimonadota bacterium]|nr:COX15/CtaA family protein [Gemmatimonadota bacterium]
MDTTLDRRTIGRWLAIWAASLFVLVLVGGGTRLTESGLSITEWKPVSGVIPPLTSAAWQAEFDRYKQIPQYAQMNAGMTLSQFKGIFWWEFIHRFWARFVGVVFVVPLFWFWIRKRLPRDLIPHLAALGVLMGLQGAMGWYMVASGLTQRINVSQYRLAAHLSLALVIYLYTVWTADRLLHSNDHIEGTGDGERATGFGSGTRRMLACLLGLAAVTVVSGAFVAGLRAGHIYNEFPLMGAGLVPAEYAMMSPAWKNLFENPAAAQFNHRWLAIATLLAVGAFWFRARPGTEGTMRRRLDLVFVAAAIQVALGVTVLLLSVPVAVGVAHQAGALLVLTALTLALREARS